MFDELLRSAPLSRASAGRTSFGSRLFAALTPLRNERKPASAQIENRRIRAISVTAIRFGQPQRRLGRRTFGFAGPRPSRCGVGSRDGSVAHRRETPTPLGSQDELLAGVDAAVEELLDSSIAAVGFGIPS